MDHFHKRNLYSHGIQVQEKRMQIKYLLLINLKEIYFKQFPTRHIILLSITMRSNVLINEMDALVYFYIIF